MVSYVTLPQFAHVLFSVMWVGVSIYIELILVPMIKRAKTVGQIGPYLPLMGKTSMLQTISGLLVLVTGFVYLLVVYPLDAILGQSPGQLVVLSIVLVLVALLNGILVLKPIAEKMGKAEWPKDPAAEVPARIRSSLGKLMNGSLMNTVIVIAVLFLMILASRGGL